MAAPRELIWGESMNVVGSFVVGWRSGYRRCIWKLQDLDFETGLVFIGTRYRCPVSPIWSRRGENSSEDDIRCTKREIVG